MLDALPDSARLWLFAFEGDPTALLPDVRTFCSGWTSHGRPVHAQADVLAGRALTVAAVISPDEMTRQEGAANAGVSGCGIDTMQRAVEQAAARHGLVLTPALAVTVRDTSGEWASRTRADVRARVASGEIGAQTAVLDLTPATLGALRAAGGAERPAAATWHAAAFGLRAGQAA